jgi:tetrahydromethanopterin S-methyltransferase subunit G
MGHMNSSSVDNNSNDSFLTNPENKIGVFLEFLKEQLATLVEGQQNLFERQDRLENKVDSMEDHIVHRLTSVELDIREIKDQLGNVEADMGQIKKTMATKDDIKPLEKRVSKIEKEAFL